MWVVFITRKSTTKSVTCVCVLFVNVAWYFIFTIIVRRPQKQRREQHENGDTTQRTQNGTCCDHVLRFCIELVGGMGGFHGELMGFLFMLDVGCGCLDLFLRFMHLTTVCVLCVCLCHSYGFGFILECVCGGTNGMRNIAIDIGKHI